jgi:prepilin-type N-terminal cleavage/methylation domain-containing protein
MKFSGFRFQISGHLSPAALRGLFDYRLPPSAVRSRPVGFTLLELLVALAVMSMMLAFMFNLMGASLSFWETGNRRMEAAQAARVGLNIMAKDLKNAFAGNMTSFTANGTAIKNIAPFQAIASPSNTLGLGGGAQNAAGSHQLCGVLLTGNLSIPYNGFGYQSAFLADPNGTGSMVGNRYYLLRKVDNIETTGGNFYFRDAPDSGWFADSTESTEFYPIIDNCIRLTFGYYGNQTSPTGTPEWTSEWSPTDRLPLGVLVTATVLDSRTVEELSSLNNNSAFSEADITSGINAANGNGSTSNNIQRLISQGAVTVRRFIPLNQS